ncbi:acyl-CoA thioesterase [Rhodospirillum rubrum]|uniref:Thioesterase n=1 Tax=Rhodospirillum rubrum (strain ATCC 11170 / ATH 1.1.1 / DSM 467 / LMG 4362 / NCIMB 8255 / S1) TaxID=269796 RepID=Q2RVI6_RHORT|nr:thioesterase family protein [Rhodospirillum rubrum]ABC21859.1 putative thioesterase [Rhodospirillum rubrum ATCC 11170]AEO47561.1 putative thioesterase [Rhodospirillum rubrum F11]MBK5953423.1 thioesterase [Rhodospirillum rubrum]QXG81520.1 acyl-CoA thioesterase [Rhodospirillum rubrum]HAQ01308.1 acyl-CoA thioesterase [Rhodospirillum rubrum]
MPKQSIDRREAYPFFLPIQMRWGDLDPFHHVNNVTYYRYFELIVVTFLAERAGLDLLDSPLRTFAAETRCLFTKALDFGRSGPAGSFLDGGFCVDHLGRTSVTYGLALFAPDDNEAAAQGHWTHVFVDRDTARPVPIPEAVRAVFAETRRR